MASFIRPWPSLALGVAWVLQMAFVVVVESGCRRTNPVWTTNKTELSVPTLTLLAGKTIPL